MRSCNFAPFFIGVVICYNRCVMDDRFVKNIKENRRAEKEPGGRDFDDNRTIADMSGLDQRGVFSQWFGILDPNVRAEHGPGRKRRELESGESRGRASSQNRETGAFDSRNIYGDDVEWSKEDRRALLLYTMKYAFGIGAVFIGVLGLVIFLMVKFWN